MDKLTFSEHNLWATLKKVQQRLTKIDGLGDTGVSSDLDQIRELRAFTDALNEVDQLFLVTSTLLDEIDTAWLQLDENLKSFLESPEENRHYLDDVEVNHLDNIRKLLLQFPRPEEAGAKKAASTRAANAFLEQVEEARNLLIEQITTLKAEKDELLTTSKGEIEELNTSIVDLKGQLTALKTRIESDESRISSALTESNEAFNKSQSDRQERFGRWLEEQEGSFAETAKPHFDNIVKHEKRAETILADIESLRTNVVDMADLAAGDILGNDSKKSARWDRITGFIGYTIGIIAGIAGIWVLLYALGDVQENLEWQQVALKFGITTGIGGVAAVAFRLGAQSLARATAYKRQELELRALTTFLNGVEGADQAKLDFVRQAFGHAWVPTNKEDQSSDTALNGELVKILQTAIETLSKSSK